MFFYDPDGPLYFWDVIIGQHCVERMYLHIVYAPWHGLKFHVQKQCSIIKDNLIVDIESFLYWYHQSWIYPVINIFPYSDIYSWNIMNTKEIRLKKYIYD